MANVAWSRMSIPATVSRRSEARGRRAARCRFSVAMAVLLSAGQPKVTRMVAASQTRPSSSLLVRKTRAPYSAVGAEYSIRPSNGALGPPPPVTLPLPMGWARPSWRTSTMTLPSNASASPLTVTGDVTVAPVVGRSTVMSAVAEPSTHHESSLSWRTNTVVAGPSTRGRTSISPERLSPCMKSPNRGSVKPRKSTAKPRAALAGSAYG